MVKLGGSLTKLNNKSDLSSTNKDYDYDELMNSASEQDRLNNQYEHFGHEKWLEHRAGDRFYRNVLNFQQSPILQNLVDEVGIILFIAISIIMWNELVVEGYTDFSGIHHDAIFAASTIVPHLKLVLPIEPFLLCSGPLGLLIVFRNDASFGRYNMALHKWEHICSSFSSMFLMASHSSKNKQGVRDMGMACWALCRTLQHEVSGKFDQTFEEDIRKNLAPQQADKLLGARSKLYRAQYDIHESIEIFSGDITKLEKQTLINTVRDCVNAIVECERLYTTPIPLLYTRHTLKFLTFWMSSLPFALYDIFGQTWNHVLMLPAIAVLTFLFFGVEEIAASLEEPFSILPLDELVGDVYNAVGDATEWMGEGDSASGSSNKEETFFPNPSSSS